MPQENLCIMYSKRKLNTRSKNDKGIFPITKFSFDAERNEYICPQGKRLKYWGINKRSRQFVWRASVKDCKVCLLKGKCTRGRARSLSRHIYEDYLKHARKQTKTPFYRISQRKKLYISDPFVYSLFLAWVKGEVEPYREAIRLVEDTLYKSKLTENLVGIHLSQVFPKLGYWRNRSEIDFIGLGKSPLRQYFEVKYQERITSGDKRQLKKTRGGIIISKRTLAYDEKNAIAIVPAHLFLSVL